MDRDEIQANIRREVDEYLEVTGRSQVAIQEARTALRSSRLGRAAITEREEVLALTIDVAGSMLRQELSATLRENRDKSPRNLRRK